MGAIFIGQAAAARLVGTSYEAMASMADNYGLRRIPIDGGRKRMTFYLLSEVQSLVKIETSPARGRRKWKRVNDAD